MLVIGVGNDYRSDDVVGLVVARHLKRQSLDGLTVLEVSGDGAALVGAWKEADEVILIDAVHSGSEAGTIYRLDALAQPLPPGFLHCSTHAIGVAAGIELARALNQLPPRFIVYGVEGKNFAAGIGLSPEVEVAVLQVVKQVQQEFLTAL